MTDITACWKRIFLIFINVYVTRIKTKSLFLPAETIVEVFVQKNCWQNSTTKINLNKK